MHLIRGFEWRLLSFLAMLLLLLTGIPGANAVEFNVDGSIVNLPPEWKDDGKNADGQVFIRQFPLTTDGARLQFAAMIQFIGPIEAGPAEFEKKFKSLSRLVPSLPEDDPLTKEDGVTVAGHKIMREHYCCNRIEGLRVQLHTVGIASQTRQIHMLLVLLGDSDEHEDLAEKEFQDMVRTLRLHTSDKPFNLTPRGGDGGLDGVFTTLRTGLQLNPFGGMDFYSNSYVTQFDPSGLFSNEIPTEGQSIADYCAKVPHECGFYALKGGGFFSGPSQIEMAELDHFGILDTDISELEQEDGHLRIDGQFYSRIPPFAEDHRFDGVWRYSFAQAGSNAFSSGSVSIERRLQLTKDGRFERSGWSGVSSSFNGAGVTTSNDAPVEAGTYEVDGYTLRLVPDGGKPEVFSVYAPDTGSDGLLIINGSNYLKDD